MTVKELLEILKNAEPTEEVFAEIIIDDTVKDFATIGAEDLTHCVIIAIEPLTLKGKGK